MVSPQQVAQPNPSYPAKYRQDTTSPLSADCGGNIELNSDTNASNETKLKKKKTKKKKKEK